MQNEQTNLFTRDDTFFGVCQGLGEDLGINPLFLRLALPVPLFFFPVETIAGYAAAGLLLLCIRLLVPNPRAAKVEAAPLQIGAEVEAPAPQPEPAPVPLAA